MKFASFQGDSARARMRPPPARPSSRASLASGAAFADVPVDAQPEAPRPTAIQAKPTSMWTGIWTRQSLLGDMGGIRPWLGKYGATLQITKPASTSRTCAAA